MKYPQHLTRLIEVLRRLPGVGSKSAERFAFQLMDWKPEHLADMAETIRQIPEKLKHCDECGCLRGEQACMFCLEKRSEAHSLCLIASSRDAFSIEETHEFQGFYHVLGGLLSPIEGIGPEKLNLPQIIERIKKHEIREVIIALDSTLQGDATALYLKRELEPLSLKISRLAFGLPMGSSLDYVDGGTLSRAFTGRGSF